MLLIEKFFSLTDEIFDLMLNNKLRKDIDDTLLEKLLNLIRNGISDCLDVNDVGSDACWISNNKTNFLLHLLEKTNAIKFLEQIFVTFEKIHKLAVSTISFALQLLGIFFENRDVLLKYKNYSFLAAFVNICNNQTITTYSPSIQDALIFSLTCLVKHIDGIIWIVEKNLFDLPIVTFSSSSYYVRKTSSNFIATFFSTLVSHDYLLSMEVTKNIFEFPTKLLIEKLVYGLEFKSELYSSVIFAESCILTLKLMFEIPKMKIFLCEKYNLAKRIAENFVSLENESLEMALDLLSACIYLSKDINNEFLSDIVTSLLNQDLAVIYIKFMASIFRYYGKFKLIVKEALPLITLPLQILCDNGSSKFTPIFKVSWDLIYEVINKNMLKLKSCIPLVKTSLSALSKLTCFMDSESLGIVLQDVINIFANTSDSEAKNDFKLYISENKKVHFSILQLFASILEEPVFSNLQPNNKIMLFKTLVFALDNILIDITCLIQILKMIKIMLSRNETAKLIPNEIKQDLVKFLHRKLLDIRIPVADSALEIIDQMINERDNIYWKDFLCQSSIHILIWDKVMSSNDEDYIKSSALHIVTHMCLTDCYWELIKTKKKINEDDVFNILCHLTKDPDIFVQRESLKCIFYWVKAKKNSISSYFKDKLFKVFTSILMHSLDGDSKLICLNVWKWLVENDVFFPNITSSFNIDEFIENLCECGYGSSLLLAIEDQDPMIQFHSAQMLFNLRKSFLDLTYCEDSILLDNEVQTLPFSENMVNNDDFNLNQITIEERDAGLDDVLDMFVSKQIEKVMRTKDLDSDCGSSIEEPQPILKCNIELFWKCLWSKKIEYILKVSKTSSDIYENNPIALLEDIIAAKIPDENIYSIKYQDIDCY